MRRRRLPSGDEGTENFWPSFADLTSTIALILFVLVLLAYIQNLLSGKKLDRLRAELDASALRLAASQREIGASETKLRLLDADLRKTSAEIEAARLRLGASEEEIRRQQGELGELRAKLQGIAVLRVDVLERVKRSIEGELGPARPGAAPPVLIADNGNIVISERLVFEYNSYAVREEGKPLLQTLSRAFSHVLGEAKVRENIDVVLVQGHTDERGSSAYNRELSAKRANAVLNYLFEANRELEQSYGSFFAASAYSEFRPVSDARTEAGYEQNRRIEISVVLKDATIRGTIDDYMKSARAAPGAAPAPAPPP